MATKERMQAIRNSRRHPCPTCKRNPVVSGECRSCSGKRREARLAVARAKGEMAQRRTSARKPASTSNIAISGPLLEHPANLTLAQKFHNNFLGDFCPENVPLIQQAASELGTTVRLGARSYTCKSSDSVGVYVLNFDIDPVRIMDRFYTLQCLRLVR